MLLVEDELKKKSVMKRTSAYIYPNKYTMALQVMKGTNGITEREKARLTLNLMEAAAQGIKSARTPPPRKTTITMSGLNKATKSRLLLRQQQKETSKAEAPT